MKVATVDIGTNSMRLLIADYEDNEIFNRKKYVEVTRINKGVDEKEMISGEAINFNTDILDKFINIVQSKNCEKIRVIGTSALRDSKNSDEFIKKAYEKTGINIEIIRGRRHETRRGERTLAKRACRRHYQTSHYHRRSTHLNH